MGNASQGPLYVRNPSKCRFGFLIHIRYGFIRPISSLGSVALFLNQYKLPYPNYCVPEDHSQVRPNTLHGYCTRCHLYNCVHVYLQGSMCKDCCCACWCGNLHTYFAGVVPCGMPLVLCQMARELKAMGHNI